MLFLSFPASEFLCPVSLVFLHGYVVAHNTPFACVFGLGITVMGSCSCSAVCNPTTHALCFLSMPYYLLDPGMNNMLYKLLHIGYIDIEMLSASYM